MGDELGRQRAVWYSSFLCSVGCHGVAHCVFLHDVTVSAFMLAITLFVVR